MTTRAKRSQEFPGLPESWADDCTVELRLRDVSGRRIAEILTEVEQHCLAAGETPDEAFGEPKGYAASLDFPGQQRAPGASMGAYLACGGATLFGSLIVTRYVGPLVSGQASPLTVGDIASTVVVLGLFGSVWWWIRLILTGPWWVPGLATALWMTAFIMLRVWGGPVLATLTPLWLVAVGVVVMLAGAVGSTALTLRDPQDLLTAPGTEPERDRRSDWVQLVGIWVLPVFAVMLSLVTWLTR